MFIAKFFTICLRVHCYIIGIFMKVIEAVSMEQADTYSLQSANVFLHCMRRKEYLKSILLNHAFIPLYNIEGGIVKLSATPLRNKPHMVFCSQGTFWGAGSAHGTSFGCNPLVYP